MSDYTLTKEGYFRDGEQLTNFSATIDRQLKKHDGKKSETFLEISGKIGEDDYPTITVAATDFGKFDWIARSWGMMPVIYPLPNVERDLKAAMQTLSEPEMLDLYIHTGWTQIDNQDMYLHGGGAISKKGNNPDVNVELPHDLRHYTLDPVAKVTQRGAFRASLNLSTIGPPEIMWSLLLATYRAAIGETDFAVHLSGKTGTFKSEICSLMQSHYGEKMDARHLPGNWSSTPNAIECQCYRAKDALIVIDDYVPTGTSWQVRGLNKTMDQIIRGQGNQAGRARLTDTSNLQTTMYPRGLIMSTGEDVPSGQSIRARLLICDLAPGDVDPAKLTIAQNLRSSYPVAMRGWIQHLSGDLKKIRDGMERISTEYRDTHRDLGHARTPQMIGELKATLEALISYGMRNEFITPDESSRLVGSGLASLEKQGREQMNYLRDTEPSDVFLEILRYVLSAHLGHLRSKSGGIPDGPGELGWTAQASTSSGVQKWKASGPTIGWLDPDKEEIYIDQNQFPFIQKHAGGKLNMSRQTLLKRMKDAAILSRTDDLRNRNTMRVMLGGSQRTVITMAQSQVFPEDDKK